MNTSISVTNDGVEVGRFEIARDEFARFYSCDHLGVITGRLCKVLAENGNCHDEIDMVCADPDIHALASRYEREEMKQLLAEYGITNEPMFLGFLETVTRRTTDKWVFFSGLPHADPF